MEKDARIYIAGHTGLVGSALNQKMKDLGYSNLITRNHAELDLIRQTDVEAFFEETRPEYVFLAAAKVGGIWANSTYPAAFIYSNLIIQANVIHSAWKSGVKRMLFLGSSCIYPRECPQPMKEEYLLTGPLETTNEAYAVSKIAGIKMCQSYNLQYGTRFFSAMPTNLFGPNDNFDLETSHVLPALIRKFYEAKVNNRPEVEIWGTGNPRREFLHVDDLADACTFIMGLENKIYDALAAGKTPLINIGFGKDISVSELAEMIKGIVGFRGKVVFDTTKPDGTPRKLLDVARLKNLGWEPAISLQRGIRQTYNWCLKESIFNKYR